MGLVRHIEDVDLHSVVALECPACQERYDVTGEDDLYDLLGQGDVFTCGCGHVAMVARTGVAIADRFPGRVGERYMPLPYALLDHAGDLLLTPHMLLVVIALERHRRAANDRVWPSVSTIAAATCMSEKSVRRAVRHLEEEGLIVTARRARRQSGDLNGTFTTNTYLLAPLWKRVAELMNDHRSDGPVALADTTNDQRSKRPVDHRSNQHRPPVKRVPTTGHPDRTEVETEERETHTEVEAPPEENATRTSSARAGVVMDLINGQRTRPTGDAP